MRRLNAAQRGMTMVELLMSFAISGILVAIATPYFGEFSTNARLRESGGAMQAEALFAQSEAIKRNGTVRLVVSASAMEISDRTPEGLAVAPANVLRNRVLPDGVVTDAAVTLDFGSDGRPTPFGTAYTVNLSKSGASCSGDYRCPSLRVDAGGGIRICADKTNCS
jgi:type IV fimbrial biogenesis protein FimT